MMGIHRPATCKINNTLITKLPQLQRPMSKGYNLKHHVGLCFTCKTDFTLAPLALYTMLYPLKSIQMGEPA